MPGQPYWLLMLGFGLSQSRSARKAESEMSTSDSIRVRNVLLNPCTQADYERIRDMVMGGIDERD